MTKANLFGHLSRAARYIALFGVVAVAIGIGIGNLPIIGAGCLALSLAAYVWAFTVSKSF